MESLAELVDKINLNTYDIGSSYWVDVTHVNDPHSFFVRPTCYRRYTTVLNAYGERADASQLVVTSNVVFKSRKLKMYVRGKIMFIADEGGVPKYDIYTPDYGFVERNVDLISVRYPYHKTLIVPATVTHCKLAACMPFGDKFTEKAIDGMVYFLGKEKAKMVVQEKSPDILTVELINSCPDNIATMLAYMDYTHMGAEQNMVARMPTTQTQNLHFTYKELKEGDILNVRAQTGNSLKSFYVSEINDHKTYLKERENLSFFSKKQKSLEFDELKVGMPVAAYMLEIHDKYERAIVTEIIGENKAAVQLIDSGKIYKIPICRIKEMSDKFFHYPALAMYCSAEENQLWDNALHKLLYPGCKFVITVKKVGDKFNEPNIVSLHKV